MNIKYCGPAKDYSGYGEAVRHDISALTSVGINVIAEIPKYTLDDSDFGKLSQLIDECANRTGEYDIKIIHTTPNVWDKHIEPGKYHIGRLIWETDKLPSDFARGAALMDEIWTGCEYTKKAIENSGVTVPIKIVQEAIDFDSIPKKKTYEVPDQDKFKFYGLFEWSDRKNPELLMKAYWQEFEQKDKVALFIKTYYENFNVMKQRNLVSIIKNLKKSLKQKYYAPVYLVDYLMDRHQIYRFHNTMDCFVSTHRGEGWGIPQMEAMACEKPIISTNLGGIHEWIKNGKEGYLIDYDMTPITKSVKNPQWYTPDMNWADINEDGLRVALRFAYENPKENTKVTAAALKMIKKNFDKKVVGKLMKSLIEQIEI